MTKVITGEVRFSYAHVFEPHAAEEGQTKKYGVCLLIPKTDTVTLGKIEEATKEALELGKAKFGGKIPARLKMPLRDGDEERPDDEAYAGMMFVNANSTTKPGVVGTEVEEFSGKLKRLDEEEFFSGDYGKASINFYAYNVSGNKGVACGLNNLQKTRDGQRLAGGSYADDDFSDADEL